MKEKWVVNASPLILLGAVARLPLLPSLCRELVIPEAVAREVAAGGKDDAAARWLEGEGSVFIRPALAANPLIAAWGLGEGETAVLCHGLHDPGCEVILDDLAARKCAQAHGLLYRGTIGVIVLAKRRGFIPAVRPALEDLAKAGLRHDARLMRRALEEAGESQ